MTDHHRAGGDDGRDDQHGHDHGNDHGHDNDREHDHDHDHSHDHRDHGHHAHDKAELGVAVVTVSSSRSLDDDPGGDAICELVEDAGDEVVTRELVRDDHDGIQDSVSNLVRRDDVDVVITTGGTGTTPDDVTVEAVERLFDKTLPGFGELFRRLSYDEVGTRVVGTRATAGISHEVPVFCLPGSVNAVRLGTAEIILPEAGHLAGLAQRGE